MKRIVILLMSAMSLVLLETSAYGKSSGKQHKTHIEKAAAKSKKLEKRAAKKEKVKKKTKERKEAAKKKTKAKRDAAKEKRSAIAEKQTKRQINTRQRNQKRRIHRGVKKGYLTKDEISQLNTQQAKIAKMEATYKSDHKLTKTERTNLKQQLKNASANIWSEKHDTDGKQMAMRRFGKNIFAKKSVTDKLSKENMTGSEAKNITGDFRRMMKYRKRLSTESLSLKDREKVQSDYDSLLNQYFEER